MEFESDVSDLDLQELAEKLRLHTLKTTRIEMAPWAKAYTVDIEKIYTELSLEKIENQPTGPEGKTIDDYKELFQEEKGNGSVKKRKNPKSQKRSS